MSKDTTSTLDILVKPWLSLGKNVLHELEDQLDRDDAGKGSVSLLRSVVKAHVAFQLGVLKTVEDARGPVIAGQLELVRAFSRALDEVVDAVNRRDRGDEACPDGEDDGKGEADAKGEGGDATA